MSYTNKNSKKPVPKKSRKPAVYLSGIAALAVVILVIVLTTQPSAPVTQPAAQPGTVAAVINTPTDATVAPAVVTAVPPTATDAPAAKSGDLVINIKDISETAKFYPTEVDGVKMEVLAVKAPDGSIRTALNTCQVCYDSGRGYYVQEGDVLVCQNCGNRFRTSDVEKVKGGCNPVPIMPEYKVVDENTITIPAELLKEAKVLFSNWKR